MQVGGDQAAATLKQLQEQLHNVNKTQSQGRAASTSMAAGISTLANAARAFIGLRIVQEIASIGSSSIRAAAQMEQWRVSFEVMLGSASKANEVLGQIREFADTTPFEFPELVQSAETLSAFGFTAEEILPNLRMLGDLARGDGQRMRELALSYGQMRTEGQAMARDMREFSVRGVALSDELKRMGVTGVASFSQVQEALRRMTSEGGQYFGMTARMALTFEGQFSTAKDAVGALSRSFGEGLLPHLTNVLFGFNSNTDALKDMQDALYDAGDAVGSFIEDAIKKFNDFVGVIGDIKDGISWISDHINPAGAAVDAQNAEIQAALTRGVRGPNGQALTAAQIRDTLMNVRQPGGDVYVERTTTPDRPSSRGGGDGGGSGGSGPSASQLANEAYAEYYAPALAEMRDRMKVESTLFGQMVQIFDPEVSANEVEMYTQHAQGMIKVTEQFASGVSQIMSSLDSADKIRQQNKYNRYKLFINANIKDETERKAALQALDDYQEMRSAKIAYEAAKRNKAVMLMNAIVNTAAGITSALAMSGPPWIGIAMAAIVGAMGAAQIGMISATPLPQAAEGALVKGSASGTALIAGENNRSELIVPFENESVMGRGGMGGTTVNINIDNLYATEDVPQNMAMAIDRALYNLQRSKNSSFASALNG
jgi:hypothetical protein